MTCTPLDQCHVAGVCDHGTGICSNPPAPDGTACNDGDGCRADTCQSGVCQPVACPSVDAAVLPLRPLKVTILSGRTSVQRKLGITVRNADTTTARTINLTVDASGCPSGLVGAPDLDPRTPGAQSSVLVPKGATKRATLPLTINSSAFTSVNFKAATRCTLVLTASAVVTGGSNDPTPANNTALLEVNVVDRNDPEQTGPPPHETTLASAVPVTLALNAGGTLIKTLRATVGNADYRPVEFPGDAITLAATASCTGLTLTTPVCDANAHSNTVTVRGGTAKVCTMTATVDGAQVSTPNHLSPQRCMVSLTATGPSGPDRDPSNNSTELVIDIIDRNDH